MRVDRDPSVARTGARSLRIRFTGDGDPAYDQTSQLIRVTPGDYRFQAFVRADGLTTNSGIRFGWSMTQSRSGSTSRPRRSLAHRIGRLWIRGFMSAKGPNGCESCSIRERSWKFEPFRGTHGLTT